MSFVSAAGPQAPSSPAKLWQGFRVLGQTDVMLCPRFVKHGIVLMSKMFVNGKSLAQASYCFRALTCTLFTESYFVRCSPKRNRVTQQTQLCNAELSASLSAPGKLTSSGGHGLTFWDNRGVSEIGHDFPWPYLFLTYLRHVVESTAAHGRSALCVVIHTRTWYRVSHESTRGSVTRAGRTMDDLKPTNCGWPPMRKRSAALTCFAFRHAGAAEIATSTGPDACWLHKSGAEKLLVS